MKTNRLPAKAEELFCYGIYTASHLVNRSYTPHLDQLGLTYPQYITLILLWETNNQKVTELAEKLRMGTNTLTPLLKRLEANGLVTRNRGKNDGREVYVSLTPEGAAFKRRAPGITACMIEGTSLDPAELEELQRLLLKLSRNLSENLCVDR